MSTVRLYVNVDHVATLRQQRGTRYPDPVAAATLCELAGADGITVHLREDRRHIQERDVRVLRETVTGVLNLEMAATDEMLRIAREIKPEFCTLVPEKREERTTEGGLTVAPGGMVEKVTRALLDAGIAVSLFIDPEPRVVEASARLGAKTVELHTGDYCLAALGSAEAARQLQRLEAAARAAADAGVRLGAGHGLDYRTVGPVAALPGLEELNIGHGLVSRAVLIGMTAAVVELRAAIAAGGEMTGFPVVLTAAEMRAADAAAVRDLGIPSLLLMENAGRGVADVIRREPGGDGVEADVAIVCGSGANGGDGFVCARHLARAGVRVRVLLAAPRKLEGDAAVMLALLANVGGVPIEDASGWQDEARWREGLAGATVIVDALFGTGGRGPITGVPASAIAGMNVAPARKLAIDIPSGLDADSGRAAGVVFRADVTVTMGAHKLGLLLDAAAPVGRVEVAELGVPIAGGHCWLLDAAGVSALLPRREATDHKGSSGHLLIVAGSAGKTGAAVLVGRAAMRAGAGLATIVSTAAGQAALDAKVLELMTDRYTDGDDADPVRATAAMTALAQRAQALAIGPGIPTGPGMRAVVRELAARLPLPMVLDADALNALGTDAPAALAGAPAGRVLTPHPGEMGRLLGLATAQVQADRLGHARRLAAAARAVVVLKGARTIIAAPDGAAFISPFACAALATAGSGDVLCGVIGALLARGLEPLAAAEAGVYVHASAGAAAAARTGDGTLAGDLPRAIATTILQLRR